MANHHLRNKELSLKAKGLLSLMLSLPDNWDYTTKGLAFICKDGVDSISPLCGSWNSMGTFAASASETPTGGWEKSNTPSWNSQKHLNGKIQSWRIQSWKSLNRLNLNRFFRHN